MPSLVDYSDRYATLTDEELLTIAAQEASLVDVARTAVQSELARRGLQDISLRQYQDEAEKRFDSAMVGHALIQHGEWIEITVPNGALTFPAMCPTCLKSNPDSRVSIRSEQEHFAGYRVLYTKHRYLRVTVPHCGACARRFLLRQRISRISIVFGILLTVFVTVKFHLDTWAGWALIVPLCGPGVWASTYLKRSIRLVNFDEKWLGFRLRSMEYAKQFRALNSG